MPNFTGTSGDDSFWGGAEGDRIEGLAGRDYLLGNGGDDQIFGGDGDDNLHGGDGNDLLEGGAGDDTLQGNEGTDIVRGQAGNDRLLILSGLSGDTYDGGDGTDTLQFDAGGSTPIIFSIANPSIAQNLYGATVVNIEQLVFRSGSGNDDITGGDLRDYIDGYDGNDRIDGGLGDDNLDGGFGTDTIYGGGGNDTIRGGAGGTNDLLYGGDGDDLIYWGNDALIDGGAGVDMLRVDYRIAGINLTANLSNPNVETNMLGTRVIGVERLWFDSGSGNDHLTGGIGDDVLIGNDGDDTLIGGPGHDLLGGGAGNDHLVGGDGFDELDGGDGADVIDGGLGGDLIWSSSGGDTIDGGTDENADYWIANYRSTTIGLTVDLNDTIRVSNGTIVTNVEYADITTGSGNDLFDVARLANGLLNAGDGIDTLIYHAVAPGLQYTVFRMDDGTITGEIGPHIDEFVNFERVEITGTAGDDYFSAGGNFAASSLTLDGAAGDDRLQASFVGADGAMHFVVNADGSVTSPNGQLLNFESFDLGGGDGADTIVTGTGNDIIHGNDGNDSLNGGGGVDRITGGNGNDTIRGGAGDDRLTGDFNADVLDGGDGFDIVDFSLEAGGNAHVNLSSTATTAGGNRPALAASTASDSYSFVDTLISIEAVITGDGNDSVIGSDVANRIETNFGSDYIEGRGGDDIIMGGLGADTLTGGSGNDSFTGESLDMNGDTITDFASGDRIIFTDVTLQRFTFSLTGSTLTFIGGSLTLTGFTGTLFASTVAGGGVQLTTQPNDVRNDFNGDGRSDILWRNVDGQMSNWLGQANGGFVQNNANAAAVVPVAWQIAGTGDFNGDGRDDILWRNTDGQISNWLATAAGGYTQNNANAAAVVPIAWHVVGIGDFNGDGRDDILWRHNDGTVSNWLATVAGGFTANDANAARFAPTNWHVAGTGDFNGDGRDDVLWRNDNGQLSNWLGTASGGFTLNDSVALTMVDPAWRIAGTGDFNGDGRDDILWRHTDGTLSNWLGTATGGFVNNGSVSGTNVPLAWSVVAIGDYNGDGRDDILWRHTDGTLSNWLGTATGGFTPNDTNAATPVPTAWHVQPEPFWL